MLSHEVRIFNMMVMTIIVLMILSLFILFILSHRSQQAERKKLEYLSSHDPLTKLVNRRAFEFGGDEFVILMKELESREKLEHQLNEFRQRLKELDFLVDQEGKIFRIHFSAGIVEMQQFGEALEDMEKKADKALYQVKRKGRGGFAWDHKETK